MIRRLATSGTVLGVDDSAEIQVIKVEMLAGEIRNVRRLQQYGLTTVPLAGSESVHITLNGDRGRTVMLAVDDRRYRPLDLQPGDSCLYTHEGTLVHLRQGQQVYVEGASQVLVKSADIVLDGPVRCTKTLTVDQTLLVKQSITGQAGLAVSGGAAAINGAIIDTAGNLTTAKGVSSDTHKHSPQTGEPVPG
jgi:phage baseplate assembly protein V